MKCKICEKKLSRRNESGYCITCFNKRKGINGEEKKAEKYINEWLISGKLKTNSPPKTRVRNFILKDQDQKCSICGMEQFWNGKKIVFVLDHIDGNCKNNNRKNLRMVCPNCDSQLDTFKGKNKGKGRRYNREYYHIRKHGE